MSASYNQAYRTDSAYLGDFVDTIKIFEKTGYKMIVQEKNMLEMGIKADDIVKTADDSEKLPGEAS